MDINRVISIVRTLKESPTNNTGSSGSTAGFSADASATGPVAGFDKLLHEPILDQDYQTPAGLNYRLSNVFPAYKLSERDDENMVDASKEYMDITDKSNGDSRLNRLIGIVRSIREEVSAAPTNNASSGAIGGLPPDDPPVKKKRKPTPLARYRTRVTWR